MYGVKSRGSFGVRSYSSGRSAAIAAARQKTSRASQVAKARTTNKPVRRVYKKLYTAPKTKTGANRSAISILAKQVRRLQLQKWGFLQHQHQHVEVPQIKTPTMEHPCAFMINDFYNGSKLFRGSLDIGGIPSLDQTMAFNHVNYAVGVAQAYHFNIERTTEEISNVQYLPKSTFIRMDIRMAGVARAQMKTPITFKVTLFTMRDGYQASTIRNYNLPNSLGAYSHMVTSDPTYRNHFNSKFQKVLYSKQCKFYPPRGYASEDQSISSDVKKTIVLKHTFPPKPMTPDFNTATSGAPFWASMPIDVPIWCLISTDNESSSAFIMSIERFISWRDQHGVAS